MKRVNHFIFFLSIVLFSWVSCANDSDQSEDQPLSPHNQLEVSLDSIMIAKMKDENIPGGGVIVVQNGKTIFKKGYGYANMYTGQSVDVDSTIFRIGSISKAVTLLALTKLIDDGKIGYDDDVTDYFPDIKNPKNYTSPLTIRHLLSHNTGLDQVGLERHTWQLNLPIGERSKLRPSLDSFLKKYLKRVSPAGESYRYDTYGTSLAGAIIARVMDKSYSESMTELVFDPLNMNSTGVDRILDNDPHMSAGHGYAENQYQVVPYELYTTTPASSIDATVSDMGKLLSALTNTDSESNRYYSNSMLDNIMNKVDRAHSEFVGTSHGLHETKRLGQATSALCARGLRHGGDMYGFKSELQIFPEYNTAIFIAVNRNEESGGGNISVLRELEKALLHYLEVPFCTSPHPLPNEVKSDLNEYQGSYYYGVFCHDCSDEEFEMNAWRPSWEKTITVNENNLVLDEAKYYDRGDDVFVREDGWDMIFFQRNSVGEIYSFQHEDDNNVFEKLE